MSSPSAADQAVPPAIDLVEMRRRLGADDELIREVIGGFLVALPPLRMQLAAAAIQGDRTALTRAAHTLRGALLDVGALPAAELARYIELASGDCTEHLASLSAQLDAVCSTAAGIVATTR